MENDKDLVEFADIADKLKDFISRSYEYLIPIEYQNSIIELDKKWGCFNLTPTMTVSGKTISKVLDSFKLNHNKEEVSSKSYLSVFILKDAPVNDYSDIRVSVGDTYDSIITKYKKRMDGLNSIRKENCWS